MLEIALTLAVSLAGDGPGFRSTFENLPGGKLPATWKLDGFGYEEGYRGSVALDAPFEGRYCMKLFFEGEGEGEPAGSGKLYHPIDAGPYRGKRVFLRAAVRVLDPGTSARILLRGETKAGRSSLVAGTSDEPIHGPDWAIYEVTGGVAADLALLELGVVHSGRGRVLVDAIELGILGDLPKLEVLPPAELDDRAVTNLAALGRLLAFLRYFHPSDQVAAADWSALARSSVVLAEQAEGSIELAATLQDHFSAVAPTLRLFAKGRVPDRPSPALDEPNGPGHSIVRCVHEGLDTGGAPHGFSSGRESVPWEGRVPIGFARPQKPKDYDIGASVLARLPTTLFADAEGTLPHADSPAAVQEEAHDSATAMTTDDRATRIAAVLLGWDVLEYFAPLMDKKSADWQVALETAIRGAAQAKDEGELLAALRRMVAETFDGQASVQHRSDWRESSVPVRWEWIEEKLVVTAIASDERSKIGIGRGDVVLRVGKLAAEKALLEECSLFAGATTQRIRARALESMLRRKRLEPVQMRINTTAGRGVDIDYKDEFARPVITHGRPAVLAEIASGIRYVDLSRVRDSSVAEVIAGLADAKGVVFDLRDGLRGLSRGALIAHLVQKPVRDVTWRIPIAKRPDADKLEWKDVSGKIAPVAPQLGGAVAFLADGSVVGEAEALLVLVRDHRLGEIVGEPTGGTIGLTNRIVLPGGYRLEWTATDAVPPSRQGIHGVGIAPTTPAQRTLEGAKAGRDEFIEKAIEVLARKKS